MAEKTDTDSYYVHLNDKAWYAAVHRAACHCYTAHNGGKPKSHRTWQGPFESFHEASAAARKLRKNVVLCKHCRPDRSG